MRQSTETFTFETPGPGTTNVTEPVRRYVASVGIVSGLLTLHVAHTSASLMIQENADPDVMADFERFFRRLVPWGDPEFRHDAEGPDDMPAHIRSALTATSLSIPIVQGRLALGTWQGIFLYEHRAAPHRRRVVAHVIGE